jgi:hypothetical protein
MADARGKTDFLSKKLAYLIFLLYICREFRKEKKTCEKMKAKWNSLVNDLQGSIDKNHYARHIPGNGEWAAVCSKPELSKKTKQKKANLPHVKEFSQLIATCKEILHNPERRAAWQAKYDEAKRKARKHNKPIQGRLCDYVRHEVSMALKKGEIPTI